MVSQYKIELLLATQHSVHMVALSSHRTVAAEAKEKDKGRFSPRKKAEANKQYTLQKGRSVREQGNNQPSRHREECLPHRAIRLLKHFKDTKIIPLKNTAHLNDTL